MEGDDVKRRLGSDLTQILVLLKRVYDVLSFRITGSRPRATRAALFIESPLPMGEKDQKPLEALRLRR